MHAPVNTSHSARAGLDDEEAVGQEPQRHTRPAHISQPPNTTTTTSNNVNIPKSDVGIPPGNAVPAIPVDVLAVKGEVLGKLSDDPRVSAELPLVELLCN
jgi:hypothetical protein